MIARLEVTRGSLTEYPLAEKVCGGWQNGVMFYPDAEVTKVTPLIVRNETSTDDEREALSTVIAITWRDAYGTPTDQDFADAILAAGFRRSEVPEPSGEDQGLAASCHLCVGAGGHEGYDGEWIKCSCQRTEIAEEPEWEYGWHTGSTVSLIGRRDQVEEWLAVRGWKLGEGDWGSRVMRRRVAGSWMAAEPER